MGFQFEAPQDTNLHARIEQDNTMDKEANELHELQSPVGFILIKY